ncbi:dolichyl-phosphate-mannose--protein mannosyltransferase [Georgenia faecalis]|uniref:Polyprenol-phosphate-mannose--protein mannosyltransferase n=1 Tax=Georgenia faecalis TaxID=2483799 RepID=A0ABV9D5Y1_9MICO|nr:phospholipid carrier-dependent glycosyltransferase [Georgenia faecalis]
MSSPRHAVERPEQPTADGAGAVGEAGAAPTTVTGDGLDAVDAADVTEPDAYVETRTRDEIERELRDRLVRPGPTDRLWGWIGPLIVTAIAAVLRLVNLNHPARLMFDETYYVKQAYSLLTLGYEGDWTGDDANDRFKDGDFSDLTTDADYVVHPQVGKWLIALGMRLAGEDSGTGWRLAAALFGAASVLIVARIGRRLFGSTLLGMAAGLLLAVDGLHLTESRIGLLDIFVMFFITAGFAAVLVDRQRTRETLAARAADDLAARGDGKLSDPWGPSTGIRWWLVLAGVLLGLATGVKWSGVYALAVFGITVLVWDICARRAVGARLWFGAGVFRGGFPAFFALVPVAALTYVASWWSWFITPGSYLRQWAADQIAANGDVVRSYLPNALNSWWEYHLRMWDFHNGLTSEHTYEAHPAGWILQLRPTSFYWESPAPGADCGADECIQAITSVGNPIVWWLGALALLVVLWAALRHRDWRAWAILAGYGATYLPWFAYSHRTIFTFYAVVLVPFVVLALVFAIAWLTGMLPPLPAGRAAAAGGARAGGTAGGPAGLRRFLPGGRGDGTRAAATDGPDGTSGRSSAVQGASAGDDVVNDGVVGDGVVSDGAVGHSEDGASQPGDVVGQPGDVVGQPSDAGRSIPADGSMPVRSGAAAVPAGQAAEAGGAHAAPVNERPHDDGRARLTRTGLLVLGCVLVAAVAVAVFFWPVWTGQTISKDFWRLHMWLPSWI